MNDTPQPGAGASLSGGVPAENTNVHQLKPQTPMHPMQAEIDRTGGPMYPVTLTLAGHDPIHCLGATVLDHFAAMAPDVPDWFEFLPGPDQQPPARPVLQDQPAETIAAVAAWTNGSELTGSDAERAALKSWQALLDVYDKSKALYDRNITASRFVSWRWHYAKMMLSTRGGV